METGDIMLGMLLLALLSIRRKVEWGDGWVYPVPDVIVDGTRYKAVISNGVQNRVYDHRGVDVMFRRDGHQPTRFGTSLRDGVRNGTANYFCPPGTPVLAARDGTVWSCADTPRGKSIVISHDGTPFATYYTHMDAVTFPAHKRGVNVATGERTRIKAGDLIGTIGADPSDANKLRHLHFAVWHGGGEDHAIDPEQAMDTWARQPWAYTAKG